MDDHERDLDRIFNAGLFIGVAFTAVAGIAFGFSVAVVVWLVR